jgi:protein gp37
MTTIEWTDESWNPIRGCSRVSEGCRNCYAERVAARFSRPGMAFEGLARMRAGGQPQWTGDIRVVETNLLTPLHWRRPRRIFVNSMSDLFHEGVADATLDWIFAVMALAPWHTFQILTKRPGRMRDYLRDEFVWTRIEAAARTIHIDTCRACQRADATGAPRPHLADLMLVGPLRHIWLGVSVENQAAANERIPLLLDTPAAVRFLSCEPLLGHVTFRWAAWQERVKAPAKDHLDGLRRLDWIIVGGESGPHARPMQINWARTIVDECRAASVPVFVKQLGAKPMAHTTRVTLRSRKGGDLAEWPETLRVREFPQEITR